MKAKAADRTVEPGRREFSEKAQLILHSLTVLPQCCLSDLLLRDDLDFGRFKIKSLTPWLQVWKEGRDMGKEGRDPWPVPKLKQ